MTPFGLAHIFVLFSLLHQPLIEEAAEEMGTIAIGWRQDGVGDVIEVEIDYDIIEKFPLVEAEPILVGHCDAPSDRGRGVDEQLQSRPSEHELEVLRG